MKALYRIIMRVVNCIRCHSDNVEQTHTHEPHGYEGWHCNDCGQTWGT